MKSKLTILLGLICVIIAAVALPTLFNQQACDAQSCPQESTSGDKLSAIKLDLASGAILLDVRTPEEYSQSHAVGAINLSHDRILDGENPAEDRNTNIYLYCRSGNRASQAQKALEESGYTNIENIQSLDYWQSIGGEVE